MKCEHLKIRTKKGIKYGYCVMNKKEVDFNCSCIKKEYKKYKILNKSNSEIKKITKKRRKLESERFSIIYHNLDKCCICRKNSNIEINEVFMGRNRNNSMKYGMCMPLCHEHHEMFHSNRQMQLFFMKMFQLKFEETNSREEFINIFKKNYL